MGLGINTISLLEIRTEGLQWNNVFTSISLDDNFNMGYVYLMLIVDSIIHMLIAWLACNIYIVVSIRTEEVARYATANLSCLLWCSINYNTRLSGSIYNVHTCI